MTGTKKENYAQIARKISEIPLEKAETNHKWEELVQKMCDSEDVELQDIGHRESDVLKQAETQK